MSELEEQNKINGAQHLYAGHFRSVQNLDNHEECASQSSNVTL